MPVSSNLYAEKVFSEHPLGLWPMDEKHDYYNFVTEQASDLTSASWSVSQGTVSKDLSILRPFSEQPAYNILNDNSFEINLLAEKITSEYFDPISKTLSVGFYVLAETENIQSFELTLLSNDSENSFYENEKKETVLFDIKDYNRWHFYQKTFNVFEEKAVPIDDFSAPVGLPAVFAKENHGFMDGDPILVYSAGLLPREIVENTKYFVKYIDEDSFGISLTEGGNSIIASSQGSGDYFVIPVKSIGLSLRFLLTDSEEASLFINGLTVGQDSEEFQENSLGVTVDVLDNIDGYGVFKTAKTFDYGISNQPGHYLIKNNRLLAKNKNMPIVFGSDSLTSISHDLDGKASIIFPGQGFLNNIGKYRTYTVEFWLRINAVLDNTFRIFGPISSSDGLYIEGPFLILKIGSFAKSHYVGDFYRPMLINIIYFPGGASVVINGEKVLDLAIDLNQLSFPNFQSEDLKEQDWLGFYSNKNISSFEIDCFAIYPYRVATSLSKRRYVYGQGVEFPENLSALYNGKSFIADYPFSNLGINYSYPDIGRWSRGVLDNLIVDKNTLRPPNYALPEFIFNNRTEQEWYRELRENKRTFISLKPSEKWQNTEGYMFFNNSEIPQESIKSIYGVFQARLDQSSEEVLFKLDNPLTNESLESVIEKYTEAISQLEDQDIDDLVFVKNDHNLKDGDLVFFEENSSFLPINISVDKEYRVHYIDKNSFAVSESILRPRVSAFRQIDSVAIDDPGKIFVQNHGLKDNDIVILNSTGFLPEGTSREIQYYVKVEDGNSFYISESEIDENSVLDDFVSIFSNGLGQHFVKKVITGNINISKFVVSYYFSRSSSRRLINRSPGISLGHTFVAGLDMDKFSNFFGSEISGFLTNRKQLRLYVGGSNNFERTFSGNIFRFGFSNKKNASTLSFLFDNTGIPFLRYQFDGNGVSFPIPEGTEFIDGGRPIEVFEDFLDANGVEAGSSVIFSFIDAGEASDDIIYIDAGQVYQKFIDDILSHVASYTLFVKNELNSAELEIASRSSWRDYVPLSYFSKKVARRSGKKEDRLSFIQFNFDYPTPEIFTNSSLDTSRSEVRTYVSFQYIKEGANKRAEEFTQTLLSPSSGAILPSSDWQNTRYEVVNNSVVYLPEGIDFKDLAIVVDIEIEDAGILLRPIRLKSLSLSGRSLSGISPNFISSRSGAQAYPYTKYGIYLDHDDKNPFSIYRDSTPYLYLTKYSGVKLRGNFDSSINRGIMFPINEEKKSLFALSAMQFSMRFENPELVNGDLKLFEIETNGEYYSVIAKSIHPENKKITLYAKNLSGEIVEDLGFYLNGVLTKNPAISVREWNMLGIAFSNPIRMNSRSGSFNVVGPVNFNNFSYYALSTIQEAQGIITSEKYKYFYEDEYFGVDPSDIYAIYTGTNKLIAYDNNLLAPKKYQYSLFVNNSLRTETFKAV